MSYEEEGKLLMEESMRRQEAIFEKYKDQPKKSRLDGLESYELGEVSKWFSAELKKLKLKHGIQNKTD